MSLKSFFMKKMMASKMKDVPEEERDRMIALIEKNPEFFQKIGKEVQDKMKSENKDQMTATMEVMQKHQDELKDIMS